MEALSAWRARLELIGNDPGVNAGRAARMAWDKRMFFNERRLRAALNALDLDQIERKLNGEAAEEPEVSVSILEEARTAGADLIDINPPEEGPAMQDDVVSSSEPQPAEDAIESTPPNAVVSEEVALSETASEAISEGVESAAVERQNADVAAYGLVLPEAEVWGSSSNRSRNGGLTLRPIDRTSNTSARKQRTHVLRAMRAGSGHISRIGDERHSYLESMMPKCRSSRRRKGSNFLVGRPTRRCRTTVKMSTRITCPVIVQTPLLVTTMHGEPRIGINIRNVRVLCSAR